MGKMKEIIGLTNIKFLFYVHITHCAYRHAVFYSCKGIIDSKVWEAESKKTVRPFAAFPLHGIETNKYVFCDDFETTEHLLHKK